MAFKWVKMSDESLKMVAKYLIFLIFNIYLNYRFKKNVNLNMSRIYNNLNHPCIYMFKKSHNILQFYYYLKKIKKYF